MPGRVATAPNADSRSDSRSQVTWIRTPNLNGNQQVSRHGGPDVKASLTGLPLVVRARIYHQLFVKGEIEPVSNNSVSKWSWLEAGISFDLLRVCKSIHEEAATVLYGKNEFHFIAGGVKGQGEVLSWLKNIGPKNASKIKKIEMHESNRGTWYAVRPRNDPFSYGFLLSAMWRARNCAFSIDSEPVERAEFSQISFTLQALRMEPVLKKYHDLDLLDDVLLYWAGSSGVLRFKTCGSTPWEQEFRVQASPPKSLSRIKIENDGDEPCVVQQVVELAHRKKHLYDVASLVLKWAVVTYQEFDIHIPPTVRGPSICYGRREYLEDSENPDRDLLSDRPQDYPTLPAGLWASKKLLEKALPHFYAHNTFVFRFYFDDVNVGEHHNLHYVRKWIDQYRGRRNAYQVKAVLDFGPNASLKAIRIDVDVFKPENPLNVTLCFKAGAAEHTVSMDQIRRNIERFFYQLEPENIHLYGTCMIDGLGNPRSLVRTWRRVPRY